MKLLIKICLTFVLLFYTTSCSEEDWKDDFEKLQDQIEALENDLANQKKIIESLSNSTLITNIEYGTDAYTIFFNNGKSITLTNGKTPAISISPQGYWVINGEVTEFKAEGTPGHSPKIEIGENGNWWIDGQDTGVHSTSDGQTAIVDIVEMENHIIFTFSDGSEISINKDLSLPFIKNNPLPIGCDTLRVLCLGNSYTLDAIAYLHELTRSSGIDLKRVVVYVAIGASTTLEYWYNKYTSGVQVKLSRAAGGLTMQTEGTLKELLHQDWDVVCLQQKCSESIHYETFNPFLRKLMHVIRKDCPNQNLAFAWQMVWAYWPGHGGAPYGLDRYQAICDAVQQMIHRDGIDIIIPIGTALENARTTDLQTPHAITRDGAHLSFGVGRYIAGCTWFQTILAPVFNKSIIGNPLLYELTENDKTTTKYEAADVTEENRLTCQMSAFYACIDRFHVTPYDSVLWQPAPEKRMPTSAFQNETALRAAHFRSLSHPLSLSEHR